MDAGSTKKADSYDEWSLKVLLNLIGPGKPFASGEEALANVNWNYIGELWRRGDLDQYEAANQYMIHQGLIQPFGAMSKKPLTPKIGVGVVLYKADGSILLGKRTGSHGAGQWSLPGGHMELGETFFQTCCREVMEETGILIRGVTRAWFVNSIFERERLHYVTLFFVAAWDEKQEPRVMEPTMSEWRWFKQDALPPDMWEPLKRVIDEGLFQPCPDCGGMSGAYESE
jgi:8-oxo-dGTP diphosphatase